MQMRIMIIRQRIATSSFILMEVKKWSLIISAMSASGRRDLTESWMCWMPAIRRCALHMPMERFIRISQQTPQETLQSEQAVEMCFSQNSLEAQPPQLIYIYRQQAVLAQLEQICTSWLEAMTILNSGNVGIGATSPVAPLDVRQATVLGGTTNNTVRVMTLQSLGGTGGNNIFHTEWRLRDATGTDWLTQRIHDGVSVDASFWTPRTDTKTFWERDPQHDIQTWGTGTTDYFTINAGNVGIGTTGPAQKLHVLGNARLDVASVSYSEGLSLVANDAIPYTGINFHKVTNAGDAVGSGTIKWAIWYNSPALGGLSIMEDNTNYRLFIQDSTGNVGIGTTNPGGG